MNKAASNRWDDYVMSRGVADSASTWRTAQTGAGSTLLVCGAGFDPRATTIPTAIAAELDLSTTRVLALSLPGGGGSATESLAKTNIVALEGLFGDRLTLVDYPKAADSRSGGVLVARTLASEHGLLKAPHVVIDISALPSWVYFPLVKSVLARSGCEVQVAVAEDPALDASILKMGLGAPHVIGGFPRAPDPGESGTRVWVPVLGEGAAEELRAIREFLQPHEVCPVLPWPSRDPRRSDDLLLEYRTILFDELGLEPRNVVYADESNPFDMYRSVSRLTHRYRHALSALGAVTLAVSSHSSKALSVGVLLVAAEVELPVVQVQPTGYGLTANAGSSEAEVFSFWLAGQPYEPLDNSLPDESESPAGVPVDGS